MRNASAGQIEGLILLSKNEGGVTACTFLHVPVLARGQILYQPEGKLFFLRDIDSAKRNPKLHRIYL